MTKNQFKRVFLLPCKERNWISFYPRFVKTLLDLLPNQFEFKELEKIEDFTKELVFDCSDTGNFIRIFKFSEIGSTRIIVEICINGNEVCYWEFVF